MQNGTPQIIRILIQVYAKHRSIQSEISINTRWCPQGSQVGDHNLHVTMVSTWYIQLVLGERQTKLKGVGGHYHLVISELTDYILVNCNLMETNVILIRDLLNHKFI